MPSPEMYFVPPDNIFDNTNNNRIALIKDSDSSSHIILKPLQISFFKIGADPVLVCPAEHVEGVLNNNSEFLPNDTNTVNFKLESINRGFSKIVNYYPFGGSFEKFKSIFTLLQQYIDSTENILNENTYPGHDKTVTMALKEYLSARLAHYLVLPILFKSNYDKNKLIGMIRKNIKIKYPEYWLQIESARIFLQTYYRKIVLPNTDFNLQKSLQDHFFTFYPIRKLCTYNYFLECLEKATVKSKTQMLEDWKAATIKLQLSKQEQDIMHDVYTRIQTIGENISDVFSTLPLMNNEGKMLSASEKKALIARENIILDFWASWCVPCRKKMNKLNSDKVTIDHKQYHIIYLSIDEDQNKWKSAIFSFLNKKNSFRVTSQYNQFVENFGLEVIPRYFLVSQSDLISSKFNFE